MKKKVIDLTSILLLLFYVFYGYMFVAQIGFLFDVVIGLFFFILLFVFFKKNKFAFILLITLSLIYSFIHFGVIRENTQINNCFIFDHRYPGTEEFKTCVKNLTISDYLKEVLR